MAVCKFFQSGNCRYGNSCRFEHPSQQQNRGGWQQSNNRFGALAGQTNQGNSARQDDASKYPGLTEDGIRKDLTTELPEWILSCYTPTRDAPVNLFGNYPREQSFEEIRMYYMLGAMSGNPDGALRDIQNIHKVASDQIQHTLSNIPAAIDHILRSENEHPNRHDIIKGNAPSATPSGAFGAPASNPFGAQAAAPTSSPFGAPTGPLAGTGAFGQSSALGQKPNPFGAPAFGQPAQPTQSAFGQPAALGGGVSPFGQPAPQPATTSAFGQPAQQLGGFGQTSTMGGGANPFAKPATPSAFGQPAALGGGNKVFGQSATPAFGQPAFGQPAQPAQPTQPAQTAFGQPATLGGQGQPSPFGQVGAAVAQATPNAFASQAPQPAQPSNPFGQPQSAAAAPSPFGQPTPPAAPNPFGAPAAAPTATNPFGAPATQPPAQNPFGQPATTTTTPAPNPFGQPPAAQNPFAAPAATTPAAPSPFGQPAPVASTGAFGGAPAAAQQAAATPSAGTQAQGPYGPGASRQHPDITSYSSKNPEGTLSMFKGKPVSYEVPKGSDKPVPVIRNFDGTSIRIWMPAGAPSYTTETEAEPEQYNDPAVQQQWMAFMQTGQFAGGLMPEVPPKREFCLWDF